MDRSTQTFTESQRKSLAAISAMEAKSQASLRELEAKGKALDRSLAKLYREHEAFKRGFLWFSRVAAVPVALLAVTLVIQVALGVWYGEINVADRYSSGTVLRATAPVAYWFSIASHAVVAGFFVCFAAKLFRCTGWLGKNGTY